MTSLSVSIGTSARTGASVAWEPRPESGMANPHLIVIGPTGTGKSHLLKILITGIARSENSVFVIDTLGDYAGTSGYALLAAMLPPTLPLTVIEPGGAGLAINPLRIQPTDRQGPLGPATRVSGIFARWCGFDDRHRGLLTTIIMDVYARAGITNWDMSTWRRTPPTLREVRALLAEYAHDSESTRHDIARALSS